MKYYLDSCIWRDYWEDRRDNMRPLGEFAFLLLKKIAKEGSQVIISDILLNELKTRYSDYTLGLMFELISDEETMIDIKYTEKQFDEAKLISRTKNIPLYDALHAILARDNDAILVSRDKHFFEILDLVEIKKPEDLL